MDVVAYVDGLNLYYGLKSRYGYAYFWLDVVGLVRRIREPDDVLKVRYFTSIVRGDAEAATRQETYLAALTAHSPELEITRGHLKRKSARCSGCGTPWSCSGCQPPALYKTYEEKLTDVAIGMAMAVDAAQGYGDMSLLISSDSDFHPAVDAVLRLAPDREVMIAYPPGRGSFEAALRTPGHDVRDSGEAPAARAAPRQGRGGKGKDLRAAAQVDRRGPDVGVKR